MADAAAAAAEKAVADENDSYGTDFDGDQHLVAHIFSAQTNGRARAGGEEWVRTAQRKRDGDRVYGHARAGTVGRPPLRRTGAQNR